MDSTAHSTVLKFATTQLMFSLIANPLNTITSQPSNRSVAIISILIYTIFSNFSSLGLEHRYTGLIKDTGMLIFQGVVLKSTNN